jgi:polar amino acid transport system substrate-binding protein
MKKLTLLIGLLLFVSSILYADEIKIAYFNTYPHISRDSDSGQLSGAVYELLQNHIGPAMGATFIWDKSPSPIPRQLMNLTNNTTDAVALLGFSPDRAQSYRFTSQPYYQGYSGIALESVNPLTNISRVDDLLGMKIGYASNTFVTPFMKDPRLQFDLLGSANFLELNIKKLQAKRIQAAYSPDHAGLLYVIKKLGVGDKTKVLKLPEAPSRFHVVFSKGSAEMAERFDKAFAQVEAEKLYKKLLSQYLDASRL